jgi:hypothetical protein
LHGQLRDGTRTKDEFPHTIEHAAVTTPREIPPGAIRELSAPAQPDHLTVDRHAPRVWTGGPRRWAPLAAAVAVAAILVSLFGWRLQSEIREATQRAVIAEQKANIAVSDANRQMDEQRQENDKQLRDTRDLMLRMQTMANVMNAPDLIRFNLRGDNGASGQALFSRSRGVVVNVSGLPAPPPHAPYTAWFLTSTSPVKIGPLVHEAGGTVTLAAGAPNVPRRVVGAMVSAEPAEPGETPSGVTVLSSVLRAADAEPPVESQP